MSIDKAREVIAGAPELRWAGVFVDAPAAQIAKTVGALKLSVIQLHGDESRALIDELRAQREGRLSLVAVLDNPADA